MTATKLPRRRPRRAGIEIDIDITIGAGARRMVSELQSFWSRRRQPGRAAVQERILQAIDALAPPPTLH